MHLSLFIAGRYLFSRKRQNAINVISAISVIGVAVGTTALIVVMSVFNGMDLLLQKSTDSFNPDIVISPAAGKFASFDSSLYSLLGRKEGIASYCRIIQEKALAGYGDRIVPVLVKGVEKDYAAATGLEANLVYGNFQLEDERGYTAVTGYGIAAELGLGTGTGRPLECFYPGRKGSGPSPLNRMKLYPTALFSSQQDIEGRYIISDIAFARKLFNCGEGISGIEVRLEEGASLERMREELQEAAGSGCLVRDKYMLNQAFYAMMRSEKLAVFLIMVFILLIASFNIIGSVCMLILDKRKDLDTYRSMGLDRQGITSIFRTEGMLITLTGAMAGFILGVTLCLLQERYGLVRLGSGSYIIDAYPVRLVAADIGLILLTVAGIGWVTSCFPVRFLIHKLVKD